MISQQLQNQQGNNQMNSNQLKFVRQTQHPPSTPLFSCLNCLLQADQCIILQPQVNHPKISIKKHQAKHSIKAQPKYQQISHFNLLHPSLKSSYCHSKSDQDHSNKVSLMTANRVTSSLINVGSPKSRINCSNYQLQMPSLLSKDSIRTTNYTTTDIRSSQPPGQRQYEDGQRMKGLNRSSNSQTNSKNQINFVYSNPIPSSTSDHILPSTTAHSPSKPQLQMTPTQPQSTTPPPTLTLLNNSILFGIDQNLFENEASMISRQSQLPNNHNLPNRQILTSLQINNSGNSQQRQLRLRLKRSSELCFRGKLKVRQTCSIQSKAQSEDHISYVITDSLRTIDLRPIPQHQLPQKSVSYL